MFSPHTRGWSWNVFFNYFWFSVFPTHAGVIPRLIGPWYTRFWFSPHTRGGDPEELNTFIEAAVFSPHTRGWSHRKTNTIRPSSVFPAHAGVIPDINITDGQISCFPRTRGGDPNYSLAENHGKQFSPHTRGWSRGRSKRCNSPCVFPAHAGVILACSGHLLSIARFPRTRGGDPVLGFTVVL